ncbi:hypothetical protein V6N13_108715 [Hibiscus sabdariffa]
MVDSVGSWKWHEFESLMPLSVLHRLATTMTPRQTLIASVDHVWRCAEVVKTVDRLQLPLAGWCKLNTDEARASSTGLVLCGGVVRSIDRG